MRSNRSPYFPVWIYCMYPNKKNGYTPNLLFSGLAGQEPGESNDFLLRQRDNESKVKQVSIFLSLCNLIEPLAQEKTLIRKNELCTINTIIFN